MITPRDLGEVGFIRRIKKILGTDPRVIRGIGDDAAVLPFTRKEYLLLTTDAVREDIHFTTIGTGIGTVPMPVPKGYYSSHATAFQIGWKALGVNLSDIAAMGGVPRYAVVAWGVRKEYPVTFYDAITKGIKALARKFDVAIVGGDTDRTEELSIVIALLGTVEKNRCIFRSGAKAGDSIFVTGSLGGSRKGRHLTFIPRVKEARLLTKQFHLTSMIDLSDGLAKDLGHICQESHVGAMVQASTVPLSRGATLHQAFNDGEDFELLFTLSPRDAGILLQKQKILGLQVSKIGKIVEKSRGIYLHTRKKATPLKGGFRHF